MVCGFKIGDFPAGRGAQSILEAVKARDRHIELYWLAKAMETHASIPGTFDDRTLEEVFAQGQITPLQIGETYMLPDENGHEIPGVLYDAVVNENWRHVIGAFQLEDGRSILCSVPLSETELASYKSFPDTFFGVVKQVPKGLKHPLDVFDFCFKAYSQSLREKLLEFMSAWPKIATLRSLPQRDLAEIYSAHMATAFWVQSGQRHAPRHETL